MYRLRALRQPLSVLGQTERSNAGNQRVHEQALSHSRQSFKPGEITPEEANRLGHELALRFTKGKYSFIVATHTDREHIHNHIVFNSTAMDGTKKFRDFRRSGLALQKISDLICLENGLSAITPAPYSERKKRTVYPKRESVRSIICCDIDTILAGKPKDFEAFVRALEDAGYDVKRGSHLAVKGKSQQRYIRLSSLGGGYREEDIRALFSDEKKHESKSAGHVRKDKPVSLLIDVQKKLREKGPGYARWATVYNLKQMSKTLIFLRDHNIDSVEQLQDMATQSAAKDELLFSIKRNSRVPHP